jgi:hypothetical protein
MQTDTEIRRFVKETLGCSCPAEVFNKIDYQHGNGGIPERKITVGDRLLIYIITADGRSGIQSLVQSALEQGIVERDKKRLNRFRLVLVTSHTDDLRSTAEQAFRNSGYTNEKTHLHVVNESDVESF